MDHVATAETVGAPPPDLFVRRFWRGPVSDGVALDVTAAVVVNHNRWVVRCPFLPCRGVEMASRGDRRFFCCSCGNAQVGHQWLKVEWPDDADEIERVLLQRPDPDTRNWELHETVDDLAAENTDHGVPV